MRHTDTIAKLTVLAVALAAGVSLWLTVWPGGFLRNVSLLLAPGAIGSIFLSALLWAYLKGMPGHRILRILVLALVAFGVLTIYSIGILLLLGALILYVVAAWGSRR